MGESNAERWKRIRAEQADPLVQLANAVNKIFAEPDPVNAFAAAVSARARPRKRQGVDAVAMLADFARDLDAITARRTERERRNGPVARRAFDHWQRTRAQFAEEREYEFDPVMSPVVAASMHISPGQIRIC